MPNHLSPKRLLGAAASRVLAELSPEELGWLIVPSRQMPLVAARRARMILARVRLIAALFAVLTVAWIPLDALMLPWPYWGYLAAGRAAVSLALAALFTFHPATIHTRDAHVALGLLLIIPAAFYVFSYVLLTHVDLDDAVPVIESIYGFLPFVMVAGLAIFPLTALEGMAFALPILIAELIAPLLGLDRFDLGIIVGEFWLLLLIAGVATLAGMSQLSFMIALVRQVIRDPLTECFSRLSGEELLELQFIIAGRSGAPLALAFIDLDDFKGINDEFGHDAGDRVLIAAAAAIREHLRTGDMLVRWGGEEFVLILPNTTLADAHMLFTRRLGSGAFGTRPDGRPLTCSVGLAERVEDELADWRALVDLADRRMYAAKQSGKNQVVTRGELGSWRDAHRVRNDGSFSRQ